MIILLDLTCLRKNYRKFTDSIYLDIEMRKINIRALDNTALITFLALLTADTNPAFKESGICKILTVDTKDLSEIFQIAFFPVTYTVFELYKMKDHLTLYKNIKINAIKKYFKDR